MKLLVILSILGLAQSFDPSSLFEIEELMTFVKGANNRLSEASDDLNDVKIDGEKNYAETIDKYLLQVTHTDEDGEDYQHLKDLVEKIDQAWSDLRTKDLGDDEKSQLADLAKTRKELYNFYVGNGSTDGFPAQVASAKKPYLCDLTMPEQLRLQKVHQAVTLSELRAFILCLKSGEDNQKEVATGIMHLEEYILASKFGFKKTGDIFRACDPPEHVRGKTFGELLGFLQGMIVNAAHTNAKGGFCKQDCDGIDESRITKCLTEYDNHCHKKACNGRIFQCLSVNSVYTCELDKRSDRRFPWAYGYITDITWGKEENCEGGDKSSIEQHGSAIVSCVNCMCICAEEDDETKAIRTFSLIPQFANIKNNMIVTGVRFRELGKMFHVQIEESQLGALGEIVPGTSKWKKLNSFIYDSKTGTFKMRQRLVSKQLHETFDYKIFKMDSRTVNFDLLKTPIGEVIAGVSLRYDEEDDAVELQILSWPFDFKTGELKDPVDLEGTDVDPDWITWRNSPRKHKNYEKKRFWFSISELDEPILAPSNRVYSEPNEQLKIWVTGARIDMSQHTIPYIDLQDVTYPDQKALLGGLELIYARSKGFGGFLGFRLQGYDLSNTFKDEMNQEDIDKYTADFDGELVREIPVKS